REGRLTLKMSVVVHELADADENAWSRYVDEHLQATFFHTLTWRDAVESAFGHRSHYLIARRDDRVVGVLPLTIVSSRLAGTILVSVPYAVYGGPLADDQEVND